MFSLKNIFNNLLTENRVEFLKNKFAGEGKSLTEKEFNSLLSIDPTTNKEFLQWIIREYLKLEDEEKKRFIREDKDIIKNDLAIYQKVKSKIPVEKRDINKYSFAEFSAFITPQIFYSIDKFKKGLAYATIQNKGQETEEFWITKSGRILSDDDLMENYKR